MNQQPLDPMLAHHAEELREHGYTVIENFLDDRALADVRAGLAPFLGRYRGRNPFEGLRTERVYTLVARGAIFERLAEDERIMALCGAFMQPGFLLTASQAICIHPGETAQPLHYDDSFYTVARPRPAISISTIVAIDPFTAENGGTEVIPGSHRWGDAQVEGSYRGDDRTTLPADVMQQLRPMELPAGACIVFLGTLLHRGGANHSDAPRLALSNQYCEPWARTQENFFLGVPQEQAARMSPRLQSLLGYSIWPPFMGHVTAAHPARVLREGYVNAVAAGRTGDEAGNLDMHEETAG